MRILLPLVAVLGLSTSVLAQDQKLPLMKDAVKEAPRDDAFPKWEVHGYVSTDLNVLGGNPSARGSMTNEGFVGEFSLAGTLHLAKNFRVTMRACVGCHGFEMQNAFLDYDLASALTLRAGRIPIPFGSFPQRANPVQMESSSKPLPYIMGRMVNDKAFNLGIMPAPAVDNGASVLGNVWVSDSVQLGYEAALLRGFKGDSPDIDWAATRDFSDNNGSPAGSARVVMTTGALSVGASAMIGQYDAESTLDYRMAGVDVTLGLGPATLRLEGVARNTEFFDAAGSVDVSRRLGYLAQVDVALNDSVRVFVLQDYLAVKGLFLSPGAGGFPSPGAGLTDDKNSIVRFVGGAVFTIRPGLLLKTSVEYWDFSDFTDTWVFHVELVAGF